MPRKSRRKTRRQQRTSNPVISRKSAAEFNPDYSAVVKDLRVIGILAGTFTVILIALSFILN